MPRVARNIYDDAIYHILSRGHNGIGLFKKGSDYQQFKNLILRYKKKYAFDVYHYALMPNHIHLLIKVIEAKWIPKIMQGVLQTYAAYYKKNYTHTGYLFQGRYKSIPIENDAYLMECARYIERNPLRAGLCEKIDEYNWSSYKYYAKGNKDPIVTPDPFYLELSDDAEERKRAYIEYVSTDRPYDKLVDAEIERRMQKSKRAGCPQMGRP